ncbi:MAG TPA: MoaD/ThiS family protein [Planctomycetaceae bacterium]|nr:MoaD/ThiS family protein [Planctomycetaceae bacterium]
MALLQFHVRLFARARDLAQTDTVCVPVDRAASDGTVTIGELKAALAEQVPALAPLMRNLLFAVGTDYADDSAAVRPTDEIACFPPVSGG